MNPRRLDYGAAYRDGQRLESTNGLGNDLKEGTKGIWADIPTQSHVDWGSLNGRGKHGLCPHPHSLDRTTGRIAIWCKTTGFGEESDGGRDSGTSVEGGGVKGYSISETSSSE